MYFQIMHGHYKYGKEPKVIFNASNRIFLNKYMQKKRKLQQAQNTLIEFRNLVRNATELTKQIISKTKKISLYLQS
jgi:hypothetical protein